MARKPRSNAERKKIWLQRYEALTTEYEPYRSHHYEVQRNMGPRRGWALKGTSEQPQNRRNGGIYDNTPIISQRTLRAGLLAGMSSPMQPWVRMSTWDPDLAKWGPVRQWCYLTEQLHYQAFDAAKAYSAFGHAYESAIQFGIGSYGQFTSRKPGRLYYYDPFTVGTFSFTQDEHGQPNGFYFTTEMTADQMVEAYDEEKCTEEVIKAYENCDITTTFPVLWVIEENDERLDGKLGKKNRKYRSVRFQIETEENDKLLEESGFFDFPIMLPRWDIEHTMKWPMSSPAMDALGDAESLQVMHKNKLKQLDYRLRPPLGAPSHLRMRPTAMLPGHVTYYDSAAAAGKVEPIYQVQGGIDDVRQEIIETQARIRSSFFADLWVLLANLDAASNTQKTATEVAMLHEEKIMQLTPVLYSFDHGMLRPTVINQTNLFIRKGLLPPPPRELAADQLKVEFISVLAQAQKLIAAGGIERFNSYVGSVATVSPEVIDIVDWDEEARLFAELTNQPPSLLRQPQAVKRIREARQAQQQQAQQIAMAREAAEGAKTLSQADVSSDNALARLLGAPGVAAGAPQ